MRRWDRLQDSYMEEYRARGVSALTISYTESRLERWGRWLKKRRPRVTIEGIDADTITQYMAASASLRSKSTVYGMLSTMRGFGDYLVRQGLWKIKSDALDEGAEDQPLQSVAEADRSGAHGSTLECSSAPRWCVQLASVGDDPGDVVWHGSAAWRVGTIERRCV